MRWSSGSKELVRGKDGVGKHFDGLDSDGARALLRVDEHGGAVIGLQPRALGCQKRRA